MIGYLKGTVILVSDNREILVEAGNSGVGYRILMASTDTAELAVGQTVEFHIYTQVREDAIELYGFKTRDERTLFTRLVTVSGVGAKMALAILGTLTPAQLQTAILSGDVAALRRVPGIGPEVASRLVLELESYLKTARFADVDPAAVAVPRARVDARHADTRSALVNLGLGDAEIERALTALDEAGLQLDVQGEIVWCLQHKS